MPQADSPEQAPFLQTESLIFTNDPYNVQRIKAVRHRVPAWTPQAKGSLQGQAHIIGSLVETIRGIRVVASHGCF